ncbi:MAG TPA: OsmC family protein [Terriglobales bacterium]|nr:OsmC family protein [Terriglobales bacterium]
MVKASASWTDNDRFIAEASSGHAIVVDAGSEKTANSPVDLVLIGLCACTAYDVVNILRKKREAFTRVQVSAEGERAKDPPMVYTDIRLLYRVTGPVSRKAVEDAVRLSKEKYCSVSAMLERTAKITTQVELLGD